MCAFVICATIYNTANFREWGDYAGYSKKLLEEKLKQIKAKQETDYYRYLQFIAYSQLGESSCMHNKKVLLLKRRHSYRCRQK